MERLTKRNSAGYAIPQTGVKWEQIIDRLAEIEDTEELQRDAKYCDDTECPMRQAGKPCPAAIGCPGYEERIITMKHCKTLRETVISATQIPCLTISDVERICTVLNDALNRMEQEDAELDREVPCDGWSKWKAQTMAKFMREV